MVKAFSHSCLWSCTDYANRPTSAGSLVYFCSLELWLMFVHCVFRYVHPYTCTLVSIYKFCWDFFLLWAEAYIYNSCIHTKEKKIEKKSMKQQVYGNRQRHQAFVKEVTLIIRTKNRNKFVNASLPIKTPFSESFKIM